MEERSIETDKIKLKFQEHLQSDNNQRIIFSGIFGSGKTTFLNDFFEENKEEYTAIHLYPINYSVADNKDIFELIKVDILSKAIHKGVKVDGFEYSQDNLLYHFINNPTIHADVIKYVLSIVPKIGEKLTTIYSQLFNLNENYKKFKDQVENIEKNTINDYIKQIKQLGGPYESDCITELIRDLLKRLSIEGKKKKVLVIDDLDRIDPEHIFRILNIFSAHYDPNNDSSDNKFGFDKVIIVCDIENIEKIYLHRYGEGVDFFGYIDKFYSVEIFKHNNRDSIIKTIDRLLSGINFKSENDFLAKIVSDKLIGSELLSQILTDFVIYDLINLRNLTKFFNKDIFIKNIQVSFPNKNKISSFEYEGFLVIEFLCKIFGDYNKIFSVLNECKEKEDDNPLYLNENTFNIIEPVLLIYATKQARLRDLEANTNTDISIFLNETTIKNLTYTITQLRITAVKASNNSSTISSNQAYLYRLLSETIKYLKHQRIIE
jgi:hypothetical protein